MMSVLLVLAILAGCLVGCGNSGEAESNKKENENSVTEQEKASSDVTLTIMASQDWVYDAEKELGRKFEEETGIKVDYQIVPYDQYFSLLMTKLNSGEGPDIFGGQSGTFDLVSQYNIEKNAVELTDEPWVAAYDKFAKEQTSVGDKLYGATYTDVSVDFYVVYNKKIYEKYNLTEPNTFAEFETNCQVLMDNGVLPFFEPCGDGWHHVMWFCEIGGKYEDIYPDIVNQLNENQTTFAEIPEFKLVLEQVKGLADKGYFGDNYLSDEYTDLPSALGSGEFAMTMCKPGTVAEIVAASNGTYTEEDFGFFLIPTLDNDVLNMHPCGPSRFIYSGSKHIEEAKQYLEYITQKESIQYMIDNEGKIENLPYEVGQTPSYSQYTQDFLDSFEKAGTVFQDSIKYLNPQWTELGQDMVSMFIDDMTPQQVLERIDARRETQAKAAKDENWNK